MKYSILIYIALAMLLAACEKDKTPLSAENNNYTSHDYEWEVDTLHAPDAFQVIMLGIWAMDKNNVWVVGHSDVNKYQAWLWNNNKWENQLLWFPGHPHSLNAIYGFSENDVWVVGVDYRNYPAINHRSLIAHYNGNNWKLIEEVDAPRCLSVWGSDPNNIFVGCDSGFVLYYDGSQWVKKILAPYPESTVSPDLILKRFLQPDTIWTSSSQLIQPSIIFFVITAQSGKWSNPLSIPHFRHRNHLVTRFGPLQKGNCIPWGRMDYMSGEIVPGRG